jgi:hypothetical protein
MNVWTWIYLVMAVILATIWIIEKLFPYSMPPKEHCTCLRWRAPSETFGYRYVRDTNCPLHKEG